jgi:hypothetical protein
MRSLSAYVQSSRFAPLTRARRTGAGAIVVAAVAAIAPVARAETTVATVARPTPVNAFGGRLVWSAYDFTLRSYRLMTRFGGVIEALPIAGRSVPFDADLGSDALGRLVVVYSRCRAEPRPQFFITAPNWALSRGCDLYRFDFAARRETRIAAASSRGASEYLPTVSRGQIAFARSHGRRVTSRGLRADLYVSSLVGGRETRLSGGTRSRGRVGRVAGPVGLDLNGRRLAFTWQYSVEGSEGGPNTEVRVVTLGGRRTLVDVQPNSDSIVSRQLTAPSLVGTSVFYALRTSGDSNGHRYRRYDLARSRAFHARKDRRWIASTTTDATATYTLYGTGLGGCSSDEPDAPPTPCQLVHLDPIDYRPGFLAGP